MSKPEKPFKPFNFLLLKGMNRNKHNFYTNFQGMGSEMAER